jgi:hypothetical protein
MESGSVIQTWLPRDRGVKWIVLGPMQAISVDSSIFEQPFTAPGTVRLFAALPYLNFSHAESRMSITNWIRLCSSFMNQFLKIGSKMPQQSRQIRALEVTLYLIASK